MKIISPFRDYYDRIAHQYGGGDPRIPYVRKPFTEVQTFTSIDHLPNLTHKFYKKKLSEEHQKKLDTCVLKWLVIAGKYYLLVGNTAPEKVIPDFHILDENKHDFLIEYLKIHDTTSYWWWRRYKRKQMSVQEILDRYVGFSEPTLIGLSKSFKAPVFILAPANPPPRQDSLMAVEKNIPILNDLGLPSIISAEQMYQDIAHFIGNVMKDLPDADPPVALQNREKIEKAGFDLRTSFRHRKVE